MIVVDATTDVELREYASLADRCAQCGEPIGRHLSDYRSCAQSQSMCGNYPGNDPLFLSAWRLVRGALRLRRARHAARETHDPLVYGWWTLPRRGERRHVDAVRLLGPAIDQLPPSLRAGAVRAADALTRAAGTRGIVARRERAQAYVIRLAAGLVARELRGSAPGLAREQLLAGRSAHTLAREAVRAALREPRERAYLARHEEARAARRRARENRLAERVIAEIRRRGGEVAITGQYATEALAPRDSSDGLVLLAVEHWRQYSRRHGAHRASLAYLGGIDHGQVWAVRLRGVPDSIAAALAQITPIEARRAQQRGLRVLRQGDVYAVEVFRDRAATDAARLPASHRWDASTRTLVHVSVRDGVEQHAPMAVPFPARLVAQRVLPMGRLARSRTGRGD